MIQRLFRRMAFCTIVVVLLSGCGADVPVPTPAATRTPGVTLTPYVGATAASATPSPIPLQSPTAVPTPTATPFLYTIAAGDTLIGIAFRFGLTLADLLAANPEVDPQFLVIGESLVIPLQDNPAAAAAIPTPIADLLPVGPPICMEEASGGMWCFQIVRNDGVELIEGVSGRLTVYDAAGKVLDTRTALTPVNLVPPGAAIPAAAWFPESSGYAQASFEILTALPAAADDPRYVQLSFNFEAAIDGRSGSVTITAETVGEADAGRLRAAIAAFDDSGMVVAIRVVEVDVRDTAPPWTLEGSVYSLGGEIDRVEVWVEAYP